MHNPNEKFDFIDPLFLGPFAENSDVFERLFLQFFRDHAYWRRNFHPKDKSPIATTAYQSPEFQNFIAKTDHELKDFCSDLKQSTPLFSPRYLGHMASDVLIPGLLAQMITTLYNPNNVCKDVSPVTLQKEIEAGFQLAELFGMNTKTSQGAWGHITSGGSVANYTSLRNFMATKFYPIALAEAAKKSELKFDQLGPLKKNILDYSSWELINLSVEDIITLRNDFLQIIRTETDAEYYYHFAKLIRSERIETLGQLEFFTKHSEIKTPCILAPVSSHYSWEKGMKLIGLGTKNLIPIPVDENMRMDASEVESALQNCLNNKKPVLSVVGVLGTTEFGTFDPIHKLVEIKNNFSKKGLSFPIHVDAAWGGYLKTLFRNEKNELVSQEEMQKEYRYFPSDHVYNAFTSLSKVDSITVDPHKLGYIPYPAGAYVSKHRGILNFLSQKAAYVFDPLKKLNSDDILKNLGQFILEGSKPGSSAAAVYVTHKVLPLNTSGFGKVLNQTIHACEYFCDKVLELKEKLKDIVHITLPFHPDSNVICLCINPKDNELITKANSYMQKLYEKISGDPDSPIQTKDYFISSTLLEHESTQEKNIDRIFSNLGLNPENFCHIIMDPEKESRYLFIMRHTLMNPWLLSQDENGQNSIDRYLTYLEKLIIKLEQN